MRQSTYVLPALFTMGALGGLFLALLRDGAWECFALLLVGAPVVTFAGLLLHAVKGSAEG